MLKLFHFPFQQNRYTQIGRGKREGLFPRLACRQTIGHGLNSLNSADPYGATPTSMKLPNFLTRVYFLNYHLGALPVKDFSAVHTN